MRRENATTGEETDYIHLGAGGPRLGRFDETGAFTWTHSDHLGSASLGVNAAGQAAWRESYTPFGEALQNPAANRDEAGFTGHIRDHATGLTYAQARYYNPVTARFLAPDPVGFADQGAPHFNRYAYSHNDPVNWVDPNGEDSFLAFRPAAGGNHGFVIVTNDDGTVRRVFSYGPENERSPLTPGQLVSVGDDMDSRTRADDLAAWAARNERDNVIVHDLTEMGIDDADVMAAGDAVNNELGTRAEPGGTRYQVFPRVMRGPGCNSNCGAAGVLEGVEEGASEEINPPARTPGWRDPIDAPE